MFKGNIKSIKKKVTQKNDNNKIDDNDEPECSGYQFGVKHSKKKSKKT